MSKTNVDTFTAKLATTGRVVTLQHSSKVLRNNPLGDPATRPLNVYLPAAYDVSANKNRDFPVLYCLAGFTGSGPGQLNWKGFEENNSEFEPLNREQRYATRNSGFPRLLYLIRRHSIH